MAVEPWEYGQEEQTRQKSSSAKMKIDWIFLAVFIGSIVSSYYFFGKSIIFWLSIGVALGAITAIFSKTSSDVAKIVYLISFPAVIALVIIFVLPSVSLGNIKENVGLPSAETATNSFSCIFNYAKCQEQYAYDSSSIPSYSQNDINVQFQSNYIKENQPIDISADISIMNQDFDNLVLEASCYADNIRINAEPSSFTFQKSKLQQNSVITCKGNYQPASKLSIKLDAKYKAEATLPVSIGKGEISGKRVSSMKYDSPYKLSISLGFDQPLRRSDSYKMPITIEKQKNMLIQNLEYLKVSTKKEITIACDDLPGNTIANLDREALKKYLIDPVKDLYYFRCNLIVDDVPETVETAYVESEAIYSAEATYETSLNIIK